MKKIFLLPLVTILILGTLLGACGIQPTITAQEQTVLDNQSTAQTTPSSEKTTGELDEIDTEMFERLSKMYAAFRTDADKIWGSGFRLDRDIIYLVRHGLENDENRGKNNVYGYVINHPNPEKIEGATPVTLNKDLNLPPVYRVTKLNNDRIAESPNFDFEYPLGGEQVMMLRYTTPDVEDFAAPVSSDWLAYLSHETFHRFQGRTWEEGEVNQDLTNYDFSAEAIALIFLEHRILLGGLQAEDEAARAEALQQFVAVRQLREQKYGEQIRTLDGQQERFEGTALYTEHTLGELLGNEEINLNLDTFGKSLAQTEFDPEFENVPETLGFFRFYDTGAVLSRLLDLQNIAWKADLSAGKTHYDIIKEHYDMKEFDTLVESAKSTYNFNELLEKGKVAADIAAKQSRDIFDDGEEEGEEAFSTVFLPLIS